MEPQELQQLREETERVWQAVGQVSYGPTSAEMKSLAFRRSLYIAQDLQAGELLTRENLRCVRPGFGLAPKHLDSLAGPARWAGGEGHIPMAWSLLGEGPAA